MTLSLDSFALKIVKKGEELAFSNKAKIVNIYIPSKVKTYLELNFRKEVEHFKKKYKLEFNVIADENQIIPEYRIELLNKNKKIIKKIENIEKIYSKSNYNKENFINKKSTVGNNFKKRFKYRPKVKKVINQ